MFWGWRNPLGRAAHPTRGNPGWCPPRLCGKRLLCPGPDQGAWVGDLGCLGFSNSLSLWSVSCCHCSKLPPTYSVKQHVLAIWQLWRSLQWVLWATSRCQQDQFPFRGSGSPALSSPSFLGSFFIFKDRNITIFTSPSLTPLSPSCP